MSPSPDQQSSLRSGIFWSLLTFVAAKSITFVSTLVLARLVAPEDFGTLAAVLAYLALLEMLGSVGIKATVIYESERGVTPRVETAFTLNLILAVVLAGLGFLAGPAVADFFNAEPEAWLFRVAALHIVLIALGNVHDSLLLRDMEFRRRIVPQLVQNTVRAAISIGLVVAGREAEGLVIGFLAGTAVWVVVLWAITAYRPNLTIQRSAVRSIASYGGWATVLDVLVIFGNRADVAVIGRALGQGALGIYVIAQRLPELIIENVAWSLSIVAFPALSRRREEGMANTTINLIKYGALFGLPVGAGIAILATPLVVVLFGDKWVEAGAVMSAFAVMYGLHTIVFALGDVFKALGRQRVMAAINAVAIPVMIVAMVLAVPGGVVGVVWARVGVSIAQGIVLFALVVRVLDLRVLEVLRELRAAVVTAAGVAVGALAVRLLWDSLSIGPLLAGSLAAALLGAAALRLLAREEYAVLRAMAEARLHGRAPQPAGAGTP